MIDVSVVEAVEVDEQELSVLQPKLDVVAADGDVIEEDVAVAILQPALHETCCIPTVFRTPFSRRSAPI